MLYTSIERERESTYLYPENYSELSSLLLLALPPNPTPPPLPLSFDLWGQQM